MEARSAEMLAGEAPERVSPSSRASSRQNGSNENGKKRPGPTHALLSPGQLQAAHLLHERAQLSIPELARRGYEQWGYSNVHSATVALYRLFRRYDYPPRSRAAANRLLADNEAGRCAGETIYGRPCKRSAMIGSRFCPYHPADETAKTSR